MLEATGFVTAGGKSSRMGRDKAWLEVGGRAMIERVIDALKPVAASIRLIASGDAYDRLGLPLIADTETGVGPLEAIRTALANSPTSWVIIVGCDLPFVTPELFARLLTLAEPAAETAAVVPLNADGRMEPLCALYSTAALAAVTEIINGGGRKVSLLFERLETRFIGFDELRGLGGSQLFFTNINTPEEYAEALEAAADEG